MDRLTGGFKGASMFATVEEARQYNRLRQYEDTGLTPDELAALKAEVERLRAESERLCAALKPAQAKAADYDADIEAGRLVRLPCKVGDVVYIITENYFDCHNCPHEHEAKYNAMIDRVCCDSENRRCPLEIEERLVQGFDVDAGGVSGPGEWGYEGLEYFVGEDGRWYHTRPEAEEARAALEENNEHE